MSYKGMNVRTNLRNLRKESTYIIKCSLVGAQAANPYIYAEVLGQSSLYHSCELLEQGWAKLIDTEKEEIYLIAHDSAAGITNASLAVQEAVRRFKESGVAASDAG